MKKVGLLFVVLAAVLQLPAQVIPYQELDRPEQKPGKDLFLVYEGPQDRIEVHDGKITHTSKRYHPGDGGAQAVQVSTQAVAEAIPLSGRQLTALKEMVQQSGLMQMPRPVYGAPAGQAAEELEIRVKMEGGKQYVRFRTNERFANAPAPFDYIRQYLWRLVTEVEQ